MKSEKIREEKRERSNFFLGPLTPEGRAAIKAANERLKEKLERIKAFLGRLKPEAWARIDAATLRFAAEIDPSLEYRKDQRGFDSKVLIDENVFCRVVERYYDIAAQSCLDIAQSRQEFTRQQFEAVPQLAGQMLLRSSWLGPWKEELQAALNAYMGGMSPARSGAGAVAGPVLWRRQLHWEGVAMERVADLSLAYDDAVSRIPVSDLVDDRKKLLDGYKKRTGITKDAQIYNAKQHGMHKAQFYQWRKGKLPSKSATTVSFERFLQSNEYAKPRTQEKSVR